MARQLVDKVGSRVVASAPVFTTGVTQSNNQFYLSCQRDCRSLRGITPRCRLLRLLLNLQRHLRLLHHLLRTRLFRVER